MSRLAALGLAPVIVPQALWVASRAVRLPEADGPRTGCSGTGPERRLLIVGDSSAAGVGVDHQDAALSGCLVRRLSQKSSVSWAVVAKSGWTSRQVCEALALLPPARVDVAVIAVGVNDVKNGVRHAAWRSRYAQLLELLRDRHSARVIVASGVPPLGMFPLLPSPLRGVLGARATQFDASLARLCATAPDVVHVPFDQPLDTSLMARDGFHPGPAIYDAWAEAVYGALS